MAEAAPVDPDLLQEKTLRKIKELFGKVIELPAERINEHKGLSAYGIDSFLIVKLNDGLAKVFGAIPKTLFFEYTSLATLTSYFIEQYPSQCLSWTGLQRSVPVAQPGDIREVAARRSLSAGKIQTSRPEPQSCGTADRREPIAIVGLSGLYPQAPTLDRYWDNLKHGRDCVTEIPAERWPLQGFYDADEMRAVEQGRSYCKWGGFVDQFDQFDPLFFGISPREALSIDPQERLFLQAVWHALESAGYTRADLQDKFHRQVGVFAGITKLGFSHHGIEAGRGRDSFHPHTSFGSLANRVSYFLDITGPSMPIDTMCSSSLTAIHEACEHIYRGECALAFAGGVNLYLHPSTYVEMASQHALSRDGKCRSFGAGANGFVPGEGVGVVLLKRLSAALEDNDTIHGLILATHVNHGGKTNGYTVPNPRAQAELIERALDKAGISARDVSYIEAHGTGTELGDPIEVEGLRRAFGKHTAEQGYCRIGSAKSNIGHLEAAAGMAGLTKILLQMRHGQIAPSLHAEDLNPNISFDDSPFVINRTLAAWDPIGPGGARLPRIAGISSFGAGGANAHVIVQEFAAPVAAIRQPQLSVGGQDRRVFVPLSAKSAQQLQRAAADLRLFAEGAGETLDLPALAYTLQVGREPMEERVAFLAESTDQLVAKLRSYVNGEKDVEDTYRGHVGRFNEHITVMSQDDDMQAAVLSWMTRRKLTKLAQLWVSGLELDWQALYGDARPQRLSLPGYPFAQERYWIDSPPTVTVSDRQRRSTVGLKSIEDILTGLDSEVIEARQAVKMLNVLM
jgi:acyl transferase domain-containing protein